MNGLTAADYADTGQWLLLIEVGHEGMCAFLKNIVHEGVVPQLLFESQWEDNPENLLTNLENAVYDHPRVLEDFNAKIIVDDRQTLFSPTELIEESEGTEETFHTAIYDVEPRDIMSDTDNDLTATYSLAPGVKSFLYRTFPGARVVSNLMDKVKKYRNEGEGLRLFIDVKKKRADFIFLNEKELLSASTQDWRDPEDLVYRVFNLFRVYESDPKNVKVRLGGESQVGELKKMIEKYTNSGL